MPYLGLILGERPPSGLPLPTILSPVEFLPICVALLRGRPCIGVVLLRFGTCKFLPLNAQSPVFPAPPVRLPLVVYMRALLLRNVRSCAVRHPTWRMPLVRFALHCGATRRLLEVCVSRGSACGSAAPGGRPRRPSESVLRPGRRDSQRRSNTSRMPSARPRCGETRTRLSP